MKTLFLCGMDIKEYPAFGPLAHEHKPLFERVFKENPPQISEFTFTNLFAWRDVYALSFCRFESFYIFRSDSLQGARFFPPIGTGAVKKAVEKILRDSKGSCIRVPEAQASLFAHDSRFECSLDEDNSDYLFNCQDLISLSGRRYDGKRNLIKKFKSSHAYDYEVLQASTAQECLIFQEQWCVIKDCDKVPSLVNERLALMEIVKNFSGFNLIGGAIRVRGRINALALAEPLNPTTLVMHVLKANPEITGLYQTITQEFLMRQAQGFTFVNFEQDLGVEGLRRAKRSYYPVDMVRKYTVSLKGV